MNIRTGRLDGDMSRSFKRTPVCKRNVPGSKGEANDVVRGVPVELTDLLQGGGYRRFYESGKIADFTSYGDLGCKYDDDGSLNQDWRRWFLSK